jgi:hypothetical protein
MQHPSINIQRTPFARILDVAAIAFVVGGFLAVAINFRDLPPVLLHHFDGLGKADAFGSNVLYRGWSMK